jgi:FkbM family methyltransferase
MKKFIKSLLSRLGLSVLREVPNHSLTWRLDHPANVEALELAVLLCKKGRERFRLIQVGAHDGITADPLRPLIQKYRLEGLLIEPLPDVYEKLKANYASSPQLKFANVAIGSRNGEIELYRIETESTKGTPVQGLSTFDRGRIESHARSLGVSSSSIKTITVPCRSLATIAAEYGYEEVGLLCVDAEGMDFLIVKSALNSGIKPEIIYVEVLDMSPKDKAELLDLVQREGYRVNSTVSDLLAVKLPSAAGPSA